MFVLSRNAAILIFLTVTTVILGLFGMVSSGASEPPLPVAADALSDSPFPESDGDEAPDSGNKYAVLIGIVYDNDELGHVEFADRDAGSLYHLLTDQMGYRPENIRLLQNQDATHRNILDALDWLVTNPGIDADSEVIFFYSGHGVRNAPGGSVDAPGLPGGYALVPHDFKAFDFKKGDGLFFDWYLGDMLSRIEPGRMWITIDSCFSGGYDRPGISGPNRVVTLSSQADQLSGEIPEAGRGTFTQLFIEEGVARGLSLEEAFNSAAHRADPLGQNPQIADNYPGSFDFFALH